MYVRRTLCWLAWIAGAGTCVAGVQSPAAQSATGTGQSSSASSSLQGGPASHLSTRRNLFEGGLGPQSQNPLAAPGSSVPITPATPLTPGEREFLSAVSRDDVVQMDAASLAAARASSAEVRRLANAILVSRARMRMVLTPIAEARGLTLASAPDRQGAEWLARLQATRGGAFDRAYASKATAVERRDLERFEHAAHSDRVDRQVRTFAEAQLPALREDLRMARARTVPRG
jgi:putative membrane protein